ncbi:MAG: endolytic transglycosylase MltG [Magnetococcales bacterium]|nr:endolytic transglycosylase MltG [Magnetococcales bacterium]
MKNRLVQKGMLLASVVLLVFLMGSVVHFFSFLNRPAPETRMVVIPRGSNLHKTARTLEAEGIISSAFWFLALARISDQGFIIRAGEYRFERGRSPWDILEQLHSGQGIQEYRLVVPEGFSLREIAASMVKLGWQEAPRLLLDPALGESMRLEGSGSLEGWLFPDTYFYRNGDSASDLIRRMIERGRKVLRQEWEGRPKDFSLTPYQALILASIIEKETGVGSERPLIAGVFHNRLGRDMMLQSDPTVIYGIADFDGNITRKHLNTPTPYNTYARKGLPPTPICSPGQASIHAVFHPESTKALYFVANGSGAHVFSATLEEHERNVDRYQRHGRPH